MSKVKTFTSESALRKHKGVEGEIGVVNTPSGKQVMVYHDKQWLKLESNNSSILSLGLYDMNKQIISQMPVLTDLDKKIDLINEFHKTCSNHLYMMYGKEISYFTLFSTTSNSAECENLGCGVIECLNNVGDIKAIDYTEAKDAIEIWVQQEDGATCLYLFPYDSGVVTVGG